MTENRAAGEDALDEALDETFPASDPPANTVETGIGVAGASPVIESVRDDRAAHRFELSVNGQTAFLVYDRTPDSLVLVHTEVPPALRGQHLGDVLVKAALAAARAESLRVIAECPFAKAYLRKHPST
jgi:predicted GNAT family acetyltransferase